MAPSDATQPRWLCGQGFRPISFPPYPFPVLNSIGLQSDGRLIVVVHLGAVNGMVRHSIARFMSDGSVDPNFSPTVESPWDPNGWIYPLLVQPDGNILACLRPASVGGIPPPLQRTKSP